MYTKIYHKNFSTQNYNNKFKLLHKIKMLNIKIIKSSLKKFLSANDLYSSIAVQFWMPMSVGLGPFKISTNLNVIY